MYVVVNSNRRFSSSGLGIMLSKEFLLCAGEPKSYYLTLAKHLTIEWSSRLGAENIKIRKVRRTMTRAIPRIQAELVH